MRRKKRNDGARDQASFLVDLIHELRYKKRFAKPLQGLTNEDQIHMIHSIIAY